MSRSRSRSKEPVGGALYKEARTADVWRFLRLRLLGLVAVGVFAIAAPSSAPWTLRLIVFGVVLGAVPAGVLIERFAPVRQRDPWHMAVVFAVLLAIASFIPEHWLAMAVAFVAAAMTLVSNGAVARTGTVVVVGWIGFAVTAVLLDIAGGLAAIMVAGFVLSLAHAYYREWMKRRAAIDDRYERLVFAARLFFWELDIESERITAVHGDIEGALGWSVDEAVGRCFRDFMAQGDVLVSDAVMDGREVFDAVLYMRHRDGRAVPVRSQIRNLGDGVLQGAASDVSELTDAADQIRHQARHDDLTGLLNRRGLLERVEQLVASDASLGHCLMVIDLVRFQDINEAFGHDRGDEVLRIIGQRLLDESGSDVVARLGGNEFAVLVRCGAREHVLAAAVDRIGELVRRPVAAAGASIAIRASLGVAPVAVGVTAIELIRQGDMAVHEAKLNRLSWCLYEPAPIEPVVERLTLAAELEQAITDNQFKLWVQPKVSVVDRRLVGVEALARWEHPELGLLQPERFIPMIEISEGYHRFTDAMIRQALEIVERCKPDWPEAEVAVNLHPRSFDDPRLVERIATMLVRASMEPKRLKIEVTEVESIAENGLAMQTYRDLVALGVGLSVDDFGTGYASLHRLRFVSPTEVKLDQRFVRNLADDSHDRTIVESTVGLARSLGIDCVAEGVETTEVCDIVTSLGCSVVQGYLFGRPMPVEDFCAQLRGDRHRVWETPLELEAAPSAT